MLQMKKLFLAVTLLTCQIVIGQSITVNNTSVVDLINNQFSGFTGEGVSVFNVKVNKLF